MIDENETYRIQNLKKMLKMIEEELKAIKEVLNHNEDTTGEN